MKKIIPMFIGSLLLSFNLIAQDIIIKKNGDEIKSKILEITSEVIKYKKFESQDGPVRNINISDIFMVIYENGEREKFNTTESIKPEKVTREENPAITENRYSKEITREEISNNDYNGKYSMIGAGYGASYGGLGVQYGWRTGGTQGFGVHGGIGYFPYAGYLTSLGLRLYLYEDLHIGAQYGRSGWEEMSSYYKSGSSSSSEYESHVLYGYSFMIGGNWMWGEKKNLGLIGGIGITHNTNVRYFKDEMTNVFTLDLGFVIK